jgi:hypothetical protein
VPFLIAALALILVIALVLLILVPVGLIQRYRVGTARRPARRWLATINVVGIGLSSVLFLVSAAISSVWVPNAFTYSAAGLVAGAALGVIGLLITRWERTPAGVYYTPNRWLVLGLTLAVSARLLYGFWRGWQSWDLTDGSWLVAAGAAESLAAGALILGYYFAYWIGVRRRAR